MTVVKSKNKIVASVSTNVFIPKMQERAKIVGFWLSISGQIFTFVVNLVGSSGYAGIFALMVLEGATFPIPSEVILPFAGYLVFQGKLVFWIVVIVATLGAIIGTLIDYSIGYYLGRTAILRYGKYIRLNERHLLTSEHWFSRHGNITVFLSSLFLLSELSSLSPQESLRWESGSLFCTRDWDQSSGIQF